MSFWWVCPSFHFLIHNTNSTSSTILTYSNILIFTTDFFHFLIYSFNTTFSATLRYFNLFLLTTFYFNFFVCILNIDFSPTLMYSNIVLLTTDCFTPLWYVRIKIWIGGVTCCWTCSGCLILKTAFLGRRLGCTFLFLFLSFLFVQYFNLRWTLLPQLIFLTVSIKIKFHPYIIRPDNWTFAAWNQKIFGYALLHHNFEPQFHIFSD